MEPNVIEAAVVVGESKSDAFKRLGTKRVQNVLTQLRVLGNCSNRSNYEYTEAQVEKIMNVIDAAVAELKSKFKPSAIEDDAKVKFEL